MNSILYGLAALVVLAGWLFLFKCVGRAIFLDLSKVFPLLMGATTKAKAVWGCCRLGFLASILSSVAIISGLLVFAAVNRWLSQPSSVYLVVLILLFAGNSALEYASLASAQRTRIELRGDPRARSGVVGLIYAIRANLVVETLVFVTVGIGLCLYRL
jgi:hypothetical protein